MIAKVCGSGFEHMYAYDDVAAALQPLTMDSLSRLSLHVFEGQFSCCALKHSTGRRCDKEELALPMLGLYSLMLKRRGVAHMREIVELIENDQARFFPDAIEYVTEAESERRPLLAGLVEVMKKYVGEEAATGKD